MMYDIEVIAYFVMNCLSVMPSVLSEVHEYLVDEAHCDVELSQVERVLQHMENYGEIASFMFPCEGSHKRDTRVYGITGDPFAY